MEMTDHPYLYLGSLSEAKRNEEVQDWQDSHHLNVQCAEAIETTIRQGFDGMHLNENCARDMLEAYGFKRLSWVLSNTVQQKNDDGRFSPQNKEWAKQLYIPSSIRNHEYVVQSHPAVLDVFINLYRKELDALQMFDRSHCETFTGQDLTGKVLVMSPFTLKESYWAPENQLWLASGGFGCSPTASGRAVYATCLGDGEHIRWNREDFIGILRDEHLPDWAQKKLEELNVQKSPERGEMTMG